MRFALGSRSSRFTDAAVNVVVVARNSFLKLFCCCFSELLQSSAWDASEPTADAAAQQVSALSSLITTAPDELSGTARTAAVSQCTKLMSVLDPRDTASLSKALGMMAAVAKQASSEALVSASQAGDGRRRLLLGGDGAASILHHRRRLSAMAAQSLQESTDNAILVMAASMLNGTQPGERTQTVSVRLRQYCVF